MVKVEIEDDKEFVIKGDQVIPRSGFSRTIKSDAKIDEIKQVLEKKKLVNQQ